MIPLSPPWVFGTLVIRQLFFIITPISAVTIQFIIYKILEKRLEIL